MWDMAEKRRLNLSFSMAAPHQREAWYILRAIPAGQRTDAVCRMVLDHRQQTELLDAVRAIMREELQKVKFANAEIEQTQAEDVDENVLGFLMSLQENEGDNF